jgi:hypothetical protein
LSKYQKKYIFVTTIANKPYLSNIQFNLIIYQNFTVMKKLVFIILMTLGFATYAQTAQSTQVEYIKTKVPGVSIAIAGYDVTFIQNALIQQLEKNAGLKGTNSKGFRVYLSQNYPDFGTLNYDIYTLVKKASKKDSFITVYLLVSKGNDNFVSQNMDNELTEKMKEFLTNFVSFLKDFERIQKVDQLTGNIKQLEKEQSALMKDRDKIQKELLSTEKKFKDKEKEVNTKAGEIQKAKAALEALK